ncbi:unnamed protein product [Didymodactylos carnosus]|uniref:VWFC domain-containing protein n=1 Tax=Didymodactylos carnosus TaxID=1234261 RepID=A0A815J2W1_9BILA|nr:unnamed protein product [Didymodactylos carnosus]CAF1376394.1 unnamed protein product [Didymodactylos carnosus]CAF4025108.1 unnamed protein product [Didymodactylos carnosus]CAF4266740.1 unnamed protein product [Didymodactylos carnosus]
MLIMSLYVPSKVKLVKEIFDELIPLSLVMGDIDAKTSTFPVTMINRIVYLLTVVIAICLIYTTCEAHRDHHKGTPKKRSESIWSFWIGTSDDSQKPPDSAAPDDKNSVADSTGDKSTASMEAPAMSSSMTKPMEESSTSSVSPLEKAVWCRLANGSYYALGYKYKQSNCVECECLRSRMVLCSFLSCVVRYCVDGSKPVRVANQCCSQCPGEPPAKSCMYNQLSYPHGSIIKSQPNGMQCWCQNGAIECREYQGSMFDGFGLLNDNSYIYVIVVILVIILLFGLLLCCGGTVFFYYYYRKYQQTIDESYQQYWNNAGWQPLEEDGQDTQQDEKQAEAEQGQFESEQYLSEKSGADGQQQYMPPPYALYNASYVPEDIHKQA